MCRSAGEYEGRSGVSESVSWIQGCLPKGIDHSMASIHLAMGIVVINNLRICGLIRKALRECRPWQPSPTPVMVPSQ